jgi:putative acetyltransferase
MLDANSFIGDTPANCSANGLAVPSRGDSFDDFHANDAPFSRAGAAGLARWCVVTELTIRDETPADIDVIIAVTEAAFRDSGLPGERNEQYVFAGLREAGALTVSLVAEEDGQVVGHIAFSPAAISDGTAGWYTLGPVSVLPERQRQGIGSALIRAGLDRLRAMGANGSVLVGHPDYYPRFGFVHRDDLGYEGIPPEVVFALSFDGQYPTGVVTDHPAFHTAGATS